MSLRKGAAIMINDIPLRDLSGTKPPELLRQAFEKEVWDYALIYVHLKYITIETVKKALLGPSITDFKCGSMGEADWKHGVAIVVESSYGIEETIKTMKHEVRHFYDGPHPWREEKDTWVAFSGLL